MAEPYLWKLWRTIGAEEDWKNIYLTNFEGLLPPIGDIGHVGIVMQNLRSSQPMYFDSLISELICGLVDDELLQWRKEFETICPPNPASIHNIILRIPTFPLYNAIKKCLWDELLHMERLVLTAIQDWMQQIEQTIPERQYDLTWFEQPIKQVLFLIDTWSKVILRFSKACRPSPFANVNKDFKIYANNHRWTVKSICNVRSLFQRVLNIMVWLEQAVQIDHLRDMVRSLHDQIEYTLMTIISQALIITQQPQSTIKKETKFELEGRIIGCDDCYTLNRKSGLELSVINQKDAEILHRPGSYLTEDVIAGCGQVLPSKTSSKYKEPFYDEKDNSVVVSFEKMNILERPHDGVTRAVLKQKFYILFHSVVEFEGRLLKVWACSTPFVYTTNVSQDVEGTATIFWDMYVFYKTPFDVEAEAPVYKVRAALSRYIGRETDIDWTPTSINLDYLINKISATRPNVGENTVLRAQIDELPDVEVQTTTMAKSITFWKWFRSALKFAKENVYQHWKVGHIIGFIGRDTAEELIQSWDLSIPGLFLFRFAGSLEGRLSVTWGQDSPRGLRQPVSGHVPNEGQFCSEFNKKVCHNNGLESLIYVDPRTNSYAHKHKSQAFSATTDDMDEAGPVLKTSLNKKPYVKGCTVWAFEKLNQDGLPIHGPTTPSMPNVGSPVYYNSNAFNHQQS